MAYKLVYTPTFDRDLSRILDYILFKLRNPIAADSFLCELEKAVQSVAEYPTATAPYPSKYPRPLPYYRLNVKNYAAFYVVYDDIVEFRRLLYGYANIPAALDDITK